MLCSSQIGLYQSLPHQPYVVVAMTSRLADQQFCLQTPFLGRVHVRVQHRIHQHEVSTRVIELGTAGHCEAASSARPQSPRFPTRFSNCKNSSITTTNTYRQVLGSEDAAAYICLDAGVKIAVMRSAKDFFGVDSFASTGLYNCDRDNASQPDHFTSHSLISPHPATWPI